MLVQLREEWDAIRGLTEEVPGVSLARAATRVMCTVRQNFPFLFDVAATATPGFSPATGSYQITNWFWDRTCQEQPVPANSRLGGGQVGGQCPGVLYTVTASVNNAGIGLPPNNIQSISLTNCLGPIKDIWISTRPGGNGRQFVLNVLDADDTVPREAVIGSDAVGNPQITNPRYTISPVDACGPRTGLPPLPVTPPPVSFPITVQLGDEVRTRTVNLPTLDVSNWPQFTFSPTIQIDGVTFEFDFGGVTISFEGGSSTPPGPTPTNISEDIENISNQITTVNNTVNQIDNSVNNVENTVTNITEILQGDEIVDLTQILNAIKCYCGEENATYQSAPIVTGTSGGVFTLPANTVAIVVTGNPSSNLRVRSQAGGGSSPDVYWWGHIAVAYGGADGGTRVPLQFESQSIRCDDGASHIVVSPYYELTCSVTAIVKELNCNV